MRRRSRSPAIRAKLGLDRPLYEQFAVWLGNAAAGRSRRLDLLQPARSRALFAQRIEPTISLTIIDHDHDGPARRADRRDRGLARRHVDRPCRDELRRARLLAADLRGRLPADLRAGDQAGSCCPIQGYTPLARWDLAVAAPPRPAEPDARLELHGPDRAHHARQRAGGAEPGLHPHRARSRGWQPGSCCSTTRLPMPRCRSSRSSASASPCCSAAWWSPRASSPSPASAASSSMRSCTRDYPVIQGVLLIFSGVYVLAQSDHRSALRRARSPHPVLTPAA